MSSPNQWKTPPAKTLLAALEADGASSKVVHAHAHARVVLFSRTNLDASFTEAAVAGGGGAPNKAEGREELRVQQPLPRARAPTPQQCKRCGIAFQDPQQRGELAQDEHETGARPARQHLHPRRAPSAVTAVNEPGVQEDFVVMANAVLAD